MMRLQQLDMYNTALKVNIIEFPVHINYTFIVATNGYKHELPPLTLTSYLFLFYIIIDTNSRRPHKQHGYVSSYRVTWWNKSQDFFGLLNVYLKVRIHFFAKQSQTILNLSALNLFINVRNCLG